MAGIVSRYFDGFRRWSDFAGRSRRLDYWTFVLINMLITMAIQVVGGGIVFAVASSSRGAAEIAGGISILLFVVVLLFSLIILIPSLALAFRRLHDTGKSGWWILLALVPFIGILVLFIFAVMDSTPGSNQYGPNPKGM